jgi:hypothetical protein
LEKKELSQRNNMNLYLVYIGVACFWSGLGVLLIVLLRNCDNFLFSSELEGQVVVWVNLEVIGRFQGVDHFRLTVGSSHGSFLEGSAGQNTDTVSIDHDEILGLVQVES